VRWGTPSRRARRATARASRRTRPQAVVHRDGDELRPALARATPARGQHEQRRRIGTAGHRQDQEAAWRADRTASSPRRRRPAPHSSAADTLLLSLDALLHARGCAREFTRTSPSDAQAASFSRARRATARDEAAHRAPWAFDSYLVETLRKASAASRKRLALEQAFTEPIGGVAGEPIGRIFAQESCESHPRRARSPCAARSHTQGRTRRAAIATAAA